MARQLIFAGVMTKLTTIDSLQLATITGGQNWTGQPSQGVARTDAQVYGNLFANAHKVTPLPDARSTMGQYPYNQS